MNFLCLGWPGTMILLSSVSQVARITDISHQCPAYTITSWIPNSFPSNWLFRHMEVLFHKPFHTQYNKHLSFTASSPPHSHIYCAKPVSIWHLMVSLPTKFGRNQNGGNLGFRELQLELGDGIGTFQPDIKTLGGPGEPSTRPGQQLSLSCQSSPSTCRLWSDLLI
jgi:hypothetical protein